MARVPIAPEYFSVPEEGADDPRPRLLGSRCPACGEHFYPRRLVCAKCLHEGCEDVVLSPTGTLWTYTYVHVPLFAKKDAKVEGYGVGQVDLVEVRASRRSSWAVPTTSRSAWTSSSTPRRCARTTTATTS